MVFAAGALVGLVRYRHRWLRADAVLLWGALLAFGSSLVVDVVVGSGPEVEDITKLFGIIALVAYAASSWLALAATVKGATDARGRTSPPPADDTILLDDTPDRRAAVERRGT